MKQNPKCTSFENNNYIEYGQNSLQKINISFEIGLIANGGRKETGGILKDFTFGLGTHI